MRFCELSYDSYDFTSIKFMLKCQQIITDYKIYKFYRLSGAIAEAIVTVSYSPFLKILMENIVLYSKPLAEKIIFVFSFETLMEDINLYLESLVKNISFLFGMLLITELGTSDTSIDISIFDTYRIQKKVSKYRT
jgi:hypothetical protein